MTRSSSAMPTSHQGVNVMTIRTIETALAASMVVGHRPTSNPYPNAVTTNARAARPARTTATMRLSPSSHEWAASNGMSATAVNGRVHMTTWTAAWPSRKATNSAHIVTLPRGR